MRRANPRTSLRHPIGVAARTIAKDTCVSPWNSVEPAPLLAGGREHLARTAYKNPSAPSPRLDPAQSTGHATLRAGAGQAGAAREALARTAENTVATGAAHLMG